MPVDDVFRAYLGRLGWDRPPAPDSAALADLMARHMQRVPFENLDIVAGTPRPLSTGTALEKIVWLGRGGFCYELNEAFRALLEHVGFTVRRIEGRVWQAPLQRFGEPFDHMALVVSLGSEDFLVDVGFGNGNRAPLTLPEGSVQDVSGDYHLSHARTGVLCLSSAFQPLYELTLAEQPLEAFASMCRYHQTSSESLFSTGLICTRTTAAGRVTLSRNRLVIIDGGVRTELFVDDAAAVLRDQFGITICRTSNDHGSTIAC